MNYRTFVTHFTPIEKAKYTRFDENLGKGYGKKDTRLEYASSFFSINNAMYSSNTN